MRKVNRVSHLGPDENGEGFAVRGGYEEQILWEENYDYGSGLWN